MKKAKTLVVTVFFSAVISMTAFAGEWKHEPAGWWYLNDDGSYPAKCWKVIDTKQYYFNEQGYLVTNSITPDGKRVDSNGEIIQESDKANTPAPTQAPANGNYDKEIETKLNELDKNKPTVKNGEVLVDPTQDFEDAAGQWGWQ